MPSDNSGFTCGWFRSLVNELLEHVAPLQTLSVLVKVVASQTVVRRRAQQPAIQKIIVELPPSVAFRADRVERLKQQALQAMLRRDRRPPLAGIKALPKLGPRVLQTARTRGCRAGTRVSGEM